jgi:hypothetical protein
VAASVTIELDTTPPAGVTVAIDADAAYTSDPNVSVAIASSSPDAAQVLIYGDVDPADNPSIQPLEANSSWITLASPHAVKLSTGDGTKTVRVKVRDDVNNPSAEVTDSIILDTTVPTVAVSSGPTPAKISKQSTKRTSSLTWSVDEDVTAWEVRVVPSTGSDHTAGAVLGTANGSTNASGGALTASTPVTTTVDGADLEAASAGDGSKVVKVFAQSASGIWSV